MTATIIILSLLLIEKKSHSVDMKKSEIMPDIIHDYKLPSLNPYSDFTDSKIVVCILSHAVRHHQHVRNLQYVNGLKQWFSYNFPAITIFSDNSVSHEKDLPPIIKKTIPNNVLYHFPKSSYSNINANWLEQWKHIMNDYNDIIDSSEYIVCVEPRTNILYPNLLLSFLKHRKSVVAESDHTFTGHFIVKTSLFQDYISRQVTHDETDFVEGSLGNYLQDKDIIKIPFEFSGIFRYPQSNLHLKSI